MVFNGVKTVERVLQVSHGLVVSFQWADPFQVKAGGGGRIIDLGRALHGNHAFAASEPTPSRLWRRTRLRWRKRPATRLGC